jgi:hypothetical protein
MIKRKQRVPMRDLSQLSAEDADTAVKHRVNGRDLNLFNHAMGDIPKQEPDRDFVIFPLPPRPLPPASPPPK